MLHSLAILLLLTATALNAVTFRYSARVINVSADAKSVGLADFQKHFGLTAVRTGPGSHDIEIPFSGLLSYTYPQKNQGDAFNGFYELAAFQINGISLQRRPPGSSPNSKTIRILKAGQSHSFQDRDSFIVSLWNLIVPSSDGKERSLSLDLEIEVPRGTLTTDLPPDFAFFAKGVTFKSIPSVLYYVDRNGPNPGVLGGSTLWSDLTGVCGALGSPDTDKDGIYDCWETSGIDINNDGVVDFHRRLPPGLRQIVKTHLAVR